VKRTLPEYMVPSAVVVLEEMPLTANGKVDRKRLPEPEGRLTGGEYVGPRTEVEEKLVEIWQQVLNLERVGVHDNFFELGGDSILSIQIVVRARAAGIRMTPKDIFYCQSIAELAMTAGRQQVVIQEQGTVSGPVVLTPVQRWFLELDMEEKHHFNQSVLLEVKEGLPAAIVKKVINKIVEHHDALRLRFELRGGEWRQFNAPAEQEVVFQELDLSRIPELEQAGTITAEAAKLQTTLDVTKGPLIRGQWFHLKPGGPSRLLIVIHHLAVDGVSWRILLEDLQEGCQQLLQGQELRFAAKTTSFQQWAQRLKEYAESAAMQKELTYWTRLGAERFELLPRDGLVAGHGRRSYLSISLDKKETELLLHDIPQRYRTQINDVLLTALLLAFEQLTGQRRLRLDLEGHGREDLFDDMDVTRTIGWFTSIYPVVLELSELGIGAALKSVKEQLRGIPNSGISYGLLRYLNPRGANRLKGVPAAEVSFNYLGQLDQLVRTGGDFALAGECSGPTESEKAKPRYLLNISAWTIEGQLTLGVVYDEGIHSRATIDTFGRAFISSLGRVIAHCRSTNRISLSTSDVPLARLSQQELNEILDASGDIEDVYPLSPLQEGILFHSLYTPNSGMYFLQLRTVIKGKLNLSCFKQAWRALIAKHAILRTSFVWEGLERCHQIVHQSADATWDHRDWRELSSEMQGESLRLYLEQDRGKGFDFSKAPLMRFGLFRLSKDSWDFVWSSHHLLFDGWSLRLLFVDVLGFYERLCHGQAIATDHSLPYREFIAWIEKREWEEAEGYWRNGLSGFTVPTPIGAAQISPASDSSARGELRNDLPMELAEKLQTVAKKMRLTLNTLFQGAWALLLSQYSGRDDIMFGVTMSGRPAELSGVDRMVGLFINTLPFRVRIDLASGLGEWLKQLQEDQVELRRYDYSPLTKIQSWSEIQRGVPLFESIMAFENFPTETSLRTDHCGLEVEDPVLLEADNYALVLVVTVKPRLTTVIKYDRWRFTDDAIASIAAALQQIIENIADNSDASLVEVLGGGGPLEHSAGMSNYGADRAQYNF
jgi:non-ribosomal peptide synthase protein (TIGR01720 family)